LHDPREFTKEKTKEERVRSKHLETKEEPNSISDASIYAYLEKSFSQGELKSQIRQVIEMLQRQNIETDMIQANEYSNELLAYLLQFEILNCPEDYDP
jgi:hypothetical protein